MIHRNTDSQFTSQVLPAFTATFSNAESLLNTDKWKGWLPTDVVADLKGNTPLRDAFEAEMSGALAGEFADNENLQKTGSGAMRQALVERLDLPLVVIPLGTKATVAYKLPAGTETIAVEKLLDLRGSTGGWQSTLAPLTWEQALEVSRGLSVSLNALSSSATVEPGIKNLFQAATGLVKSAFNQSFRERFLAGGPASQFSAPFDTASGELKSALSFPSVGRVLSSQDIIYLCRVTDAVGLAAFWEKFLTQDSPPIQFQDAGLAKKFLDSLDSGLKKVGVGEAIRWVLVDSAGRTWSKIYMADAELGRQQSEKNLNIYGIKLAFVLTNLELFLTASDNREIHKKVRENWAANFKGVDTFKNMDEHQIEKSLETIADELYKLPAIQNVTSRNAREGFIALSLAGLEDYIAERVKTDAEAKIRHDQIKMVTACAPPLGAASLAVFIASQFNGGPRAVAIAAIGGLLVGTAVAWKYPAKSSEVESAKANHTEFLIRTGLGVAAIFTGMHSIPLVVRATNYLLDLPATAGSFSTAFAIGFGICSLIGYGATRYLAWEESKGPADDVLKEKKSIADGAAKPAWAAASGLMAAYGVGYLTWAASAAGGVPFAGMLGTCASVATIAIGLAIYRPSWLKWPGTST